MMMMPTKICRDCTYHDPDSLDCLHDRARQVDLVTGREFRFSSMQMRTWPCGAEGRFFEPWPDVHAMTMSTMQHLEELLEERE
jgi:hypothetical protein